VKSIQSFTVWKLIFKMCFVMLLGWEKQVWFGFLLNDTRNQFGFWWNCNDPRLSGYECGIITNCLHECLNCLRTDDDDDDFCHQGWDTEIAQNIFKRLSKPTNMTIHWKALEEHFLMAPLFFWFNHFWRKTNFLICWFVYLFPPQKTSSKMSSNR
jgi:hypothetical protein